MMLYLIERVFDGLVLRAGAGVAAVLVLKWLEAI